MTEPARQRFAAHLRALRASEQRTQAQIGHYLHVTADAVRKWESGRLPDADTARALDAYLNAAGALYRDYLADSAERTRNRTATGQALSATTVLADSAQQAAEFGAWAETTNVGEVTITTLHTRLCELTRRALVEAPATVASDTAAINVRAFELLRGHHSPANARDLYSIAGASCGLLAWLAGDLGALDLAKIHGATARRCAAHSEDPETTAWVAAVEAKTQFWAGQYERSAQTAARAAALDAPGTVAVMLACQQADAYAKLGDAERVDLALADAARAADRVRQPDTFGGLFSCGPGRTANYASGTHQVIGAWSRALVEADAALAAFAADDGYGFGTVAQVHLTKTFAYAHSGDLDAAAAAARPVLDLPDGRRLATLAGRLAPLTRHLDAPALRMSPVATALREEITEFCAPTDRRALPGSGGQQ